MHEKCASPCTCNTYEQQHGLMLKLDAKAKKENPALFRKRRQVEVIIFNAETSVP